MFTAIVSTLLPYPVRGYGSRQLYRGIRRCAVLGLVASAIGGSVVRAQFWQQDTTFAPGLAAPTLPLELKITSLARQPDGKLLAAGYVEQVNGQARTHPAAPLRFNPDGSLDASFNATETVAWFFLQPSGKIVTTEGVRLNADGSRDASFQLAPDVQTVLAADASGRLYVRRHDGTVIRTTVDGVDDGQFRAVVSVPGTGAIAPFADGSAAVTVLQGNFGTLAIARLRPDGSEDPGFTRYVGSIQWNNFLGLIALPDGKTLLVGTTLAQSGVAMQFVRLGLNGQPDYIYVGPGSNVSAPRAAEALTLAGVLYDLLRDANAAAGTRTRWSVSTGVFTAALDIGVDGNLWLATAEWPSPGVLARYIRSSPTDLTIDPRPTIVSGSGPVAIDRVVAEPFTLNAPSPGGLWPLTYQWHKDGVPISGETTARLTNLSPTAADAGSYTVVISNAYGSVTSDPRVVSIDATPAPVSVTRTLTDQSVAIGSTLLWWTNATGNPFPSFTWTRNGEPVTTTSGISGREAVSSLQLPNIRPGHAGIYEAVVTSGSDSQRMTAILGVLSDTKTTGTATEIDRDIVHPNTNVYDQVLLTGAAAAITADPDQITRMSFVDLTHDIVQVEMSGAGTLALVMESASEPAPPAYYSQPGVLYVRGHAGVVVAGADETTHVSVFSVGRANAVNQALFRNEVNYEGLADLAFVAITTTDGRFGSLRMGNVQFYASKGLTGIYAPGVAFAGPVYLGEIDAFDSAAPVLVLDGAADLRITGGDLQQTNGEPVRLGELVPLRFTAGTTSHGEILPAQPNRGTFARNGVPVAPVIVP